MTLSIVIPVYQTPSALLRECIGSCLGIGDTEIICVCDSPGDACENTLREIAEENKTVKVLVNDGNRGVSYSRNHGLAAAVGKFVTFIDADDSIVPEVYEKGVDIIGESTLDALALGGINEVAGLQQGSIVISDCNDVDAGKLMSFLECVGMSSCSILYRREFLVRERICYSTRLKNNEDFLFVTTVVKAGSRFGLYYASGYVQHGHPGSTTRRPPDAERFLSCVTAANMVLDILRQKEFPGIVLAWYAKRVFWEMTQSLDLFTTLGKEEREKYAQLLGSASNDFRKIFDGVLSPLGKCLTLFLAHFPSVYLLSPWLIARPLWHFGVDKIIRSDWREIPPRMRKHTVRSNCG